MAFFRCFQSGARHAIRKKLKCTKQYEYNRNIERHLFKYASSMRPRLIVNPLNSNLLNPGIWPYEKIQPDGLIIEANNHGKSRLLLQVQKGSPEPLKKIVFYFSSQLPESVTVYVSSDKRSWSTLYMRHRPYVQRKCIIYVRDRMVMYVSID